MTHDDGQGNIGKEIPCALVSVIVPVFNEERSVGQIIDRLLALPLPLQIVVVDDGSTDGTDRELRRFTDQQIEVISRPANAGKGAALRVGFDQARGDIVVIQDADLEYDPDEIPRLVEPIIAGTADVVYGSRFSPAADKSSSAAHRLGNQLLTSLSNLTTGLSLTDMETGYKAFRREVLQSLTLRQNRFGIEPEITAKVARRHYRITEIPIRYAPRGWVDGKKIGWGDALRALYCVARYGLSD